MNAMIMRLISVPSGAKMYTLSNTFHAFAYIHSSCKGRPGKHTRPYIRPCIHVHARVMLPAFVTVILWSALFEMRYLQTPNRLPLPSAGQMPQAQRGPVSQSSCATQAHDKNRYQRRPHSARSRLARQPHSARSRLRQKKREARLTNAALDRQGQDHG